MTVAAVAMVAAEYVVGEFISFASWLGHEEELAVLLLATAQFVIVAEYALKQTEIYMRGNRQMQAYAAQRGGGPQWVAGAVMGEWLGGKTSVDAELSTW